MKTIQHILMAGVIGGLAATAGIAQAQSSGHDSHHPAPAKAVKVSNAASDMSEGEVRKVDKENGKITLKHGPIKNLDMPAMTMIFAAAEPSLLEKVKVGDKVRFVAANPGGKLTVTQIQPAK